MRRRAPRGTGALLPGTAPPLRGRPSGAARRGRGRGRRGRRRRQGRCCQTGPSQLRCRRRPAPAGADSRARARRPARSAAPRYRGARGPRARAARARAPPQRSPPAVSPRLPTWAFGAISLRLTRALPATVHARALCTQFRARARTLPARCPRRRGAYTRAGRGSGAGGRPRNCVQRARWGASDGSAAALAARAAAALGAAPAPAPRRPRDRSPAHSPPRHRRVTPLPCPRPRHRLQQYGCSWARRGTRTPHARAPAPRAPAACLARRYGLGGTVG
jgi:hypothetical protein